MPTYEYSCEKCGTFDFFQKIVDEPLKTCPACGSDVKRLISSGNFILKGTGWYKTDYASSGSNGKSKKTESSTPAETKKEETAAKETSTPAKENSPATGSTS